MRRSLVAAVAFASVAAFSQPVSAETILGALAKAYENNSELNSARAGVRVRDEDVALAKSGYRPRVTGVAGISNTSDDSRFGGAGVTGASFGIEINQSLFDGFQTRNNVRAASAGLSAQPGGTGPSGHAVRSGGAVVAVAVSSDFRACTPATMGTAVGDAVESPQRRAQVVRQR